MTTQLNKTLIVASMLLSASLAQAGSYTYEIKQNWTFSDNAAVYGSIAELYVTVDNGNSTNQSQIYSWADITRLEIHTNGTFSAMWWDRSSLNFGADALSSINDTLFTTDATGNLANFQLRSGAHYLNSSTSGIDFQFASSNGIIGWDNLHIVDDINGIAYIDLWSENMVGTFENDIPEPASIALLSIGFLGFGVSRRRNHQARSYTIQ